MALLQAQVLQATGQTARALALLDAITAPPSPRPLLLARAQAALDASRSGNMAALRASTEALQTWVAERRNDATAWALLAQCAEGLGLRLRALRADAEAHAALGDIGGAMERLRAAQRLGAQRHQRTRLHRSLDHRLAPARAERPAPGPDRRGPRRARAARAAAVRQGPPPRRDVRRD